MLITNSPWSLFNNTILTPILNDTILTPILEESDSEKAIESGSQETDSESIESTGEYSKDSDLTQTKIDLKSVVETLATSLTEAGSSELKQIASDLKQLEEKGEFAWRFADKVTKAKQMLSHIQKMPDVYKSPEKALTTYDSLEDSLKGLNTGEIAKAKEKINTIKEKLILENLKPIRKFFKIPYKTKNKFLRKILAHYSIEDLFNKEIGSLKTTKDALSILKTALNKMENQEAKGCAATIERILKQIESFEKDPASLRPGLNDDILLKIFQKLPFSELVKMQFVSKNCSSLARQEILAIDLTNLKGKNKDYENLFNRLTNVEELTLCINPDARWNESGCGLSNKDLGTLGKLKMLRSLSIDRASKLDKTGARFLRELPLTSLDLTCNENLSADTANLLFQIPSLVSLDLSCCWLRDKVKHLKPGSLPKIAQLNLAANDLYTLEFLNKFTTLEYLNLRNNRLCDNALIDLKRLSNLKYLSLSYNLIPSKELCHIAELPLESLELEKNSISDEGLVFIGKLASLQMLNLSKNRIIGTGLAQLSNLLKLRSLDLSHNQITGLPNLASLVNLERLDLSKTKIQGESLATLETLQSLKFLGLNGNVLTKKGCTQLVNLAKQLPSLKLLSLKNCEPVSLVKKCKKMLEEKCPALQVITKDPDSEED